MKWSYIFETVPFILITVASFSFYYGIDKKYSLYKSLKKKNTHTLFKIMCNEMCETDRTKTLNKGQPPGINCCTV